MEPAVPQPRLARDPGASDRRPGALDPSARRPDPAPGAGAAKALRHGQPRRCRLLRARPCAARELVQRLPGQASVRRRACRRADGASLPRGAVPGERGLRRLSGGGDVPLLRGRPTTSWPSTMDGRKRHLYATAMPIRSPRGEVDEAMVMVQDVSDLEVLRRSNDRTELLLAQMPAILWTTDTELRVDLLGGRRPGGPGPRSGRGRGARRSTPTSAPRTLMFRSHRRSTGRRWPAAPSPSRRTGRDAPSTSTWSRSWMAGTRCWERWGWPSTSPSVARRSRRCGRAESERKQAEELRHERSRSSSASRRRWRPSAHSRAASPTTSTTC